MGEQPLIIVKVGKTSKIKLNNAKAYRAVTFEEATRLMDKNPNASALIIESVSVYEKQDALNTVEYLKNKNKPAFVHCMNGGTSHDSEIASLLGVNVTTTLDELQSEIARKLALMVYTAWCRQPVGIEQAVETEEQTDEVTQVLEKHKDSRKRDKDRDELFEAITAIKDSKKEERKQEQILNTKDDLYELLGIEKTSLEGKTRVEQHIEVYREKSFVELSKLLEKVIEEKQSAQDQLGQAYDKIQKLLDIKDTVEIDRDRYRDMVNALEEEKKSIDEQVPLNNKKLEEAKQRVFELQQANITLEQQIIEFTSERSVANNRVRALEQELSDAREQISLVNMQIEAKDTTIQKLNASLSEGESLKVEMLNVKAEKSALEKTANGLREKVKELTAKIDSAMSSSSADDIEKIKSLREEIERLSEEVDTANSKVAIENRGRLIINMLLSEAIKKKEVSDEEILAKNKEVAELSALAKNLKSSLSSSNEELQLLQDKYNRLEEDKDQEIERIGIESENKANEYEERLSIIKTSLDTKNAENRRLLAQLKDVQKRLNDSETEMSKMMLKSGASESEFEAAMSAKRELELSNEKLESTVRILRSELMTVTSKVALVEDANIKLEASNKKLRENQLAMKAQMKAGLQNDMPMIRQTQPIAQQAGIARVSLNCRYSGRAQIIPVFGSGSNGITTMVVSLSRRMPAGSKVLVMDLDLTNPKLDSWFKTRPNIDELQDIKDQFKRTALSALFEKGVRYVLDNKSLIIRQVPSWRKGLSVDYFSGTLVTPDARKVMGVSFSDFMTSLGNLYDYIIVDLGKIGSSDITNEFIRMFISIAPISVVMSLNDGVESRNLNIRLSETVTPEERKRLLWVLNKAQTTKLSNYVSKFVSSMGKTVIFPYSNMSEPGTNTFDLNETTKGRFADVVETVLSKGRP